MGTATAVHVYRSHSLYWIGTFCINLSLCNVHVYGMVLVLPCLSCASLSVSVGDTSHSTAVQPTENSWYRH